MSKQPQAKQILGIVEKIGTKIGIVSGGKPLENLLDTHLPQLLTLLAFPDNTVRSKVIEVLSNTINKRVKLESSIKLPFGKVLELFQKNEQESSNAFLRNFAVIYLEMGFPQLSPSEMTDYLPLIFQVLGGFSNNVDQSTSVTSKQHQSMFLRFSLEAICHVKYPDKEEDAMEKFQDLRSVGESNLEVFLDFASDFMLYKSSQKGNSQQQGTLQQAIIPNGLNMMKIKRILGNSRDNIETQELQTKKLALIDFITRSTCFTDNQQFPILLIGMSQQESTDQLGSKCEVLLKKLTPDFEDSKLIEKFFSLYIGDPSNGISQASIPLKYKLLTYMSKSIIAVNHFPETHTVLMDALFNEYTPMKLRGFGMQYFMWLIQEGVSVDQKYGNEIFRSIISNLNRLSTTSTSGMGLMSANEISILKENMYTALGSFARKFPKFVLERFDLVERFFDALAFEDVKVRVAILQGLSNLTHAFKINLLDSSNQNLEKIRQQFENLFYQWVIERNTGLSDLLGGTSKFRSMNTSTIAAVNSAVLRCTNILFPFDHVMSRFLCLFCSTGGFGSGDNQSHQIKEECQKGTDLEKFTKYRQLDHWMLNKKSSVDTVPIVTSNNEQREEPTSSLPLFKTVKFEYPSFHSMVEYVHNFMIKFDPKITLETVMPALNKILTPSAHSAIIKFCFECLIEDAKHHNQTIEEFIFSISKDSMSDEKEKDVFEKFLYIIEKSFDDKILLKSGSTANATDLLLEATDTIMKILLAIKNKPQFSQYISNRFGFILDEKGPFLFDMMLGSYDDVAREKFSKFIALLFIIVRKDPSQENLCNKLVKLWKGYIEQQYSSSFSDHKGQMCALGSILTVGNVISLNYCLSPDRNTLYMQDIFSMILDLMITIPLSNIREPLHQACYMAIGEMGYSGALQHYLQHIPPSEGKLNSMQDLVENITKLIEKYASLAKQKNSAVSAEKILERLIYTVGHIVVGTDSRNDPLMKNHITLLVTSVFQLYNVKTSQSTTISNEASGSTSANATTQPNPQGSFDENIPFSVGEALSLMTGGIKYCSLCKNDSYYAIYESKKSLEDVDEFAHYEFLMKEILTRLVRECVLNPKKIVRQSSSIWLLSITRYSGIGNQHFTKYLKEVQKAFSLLVTENNEITSEVAGKGLGYVYEMAESSERKQLVNSLMNYLIGNKKASKNTTPQSMEDDEAELMLFPPGEEHQKGSKNAPSLSTYKELVDAATDIGRPEMIYQLLAVSNHNAIWNAKKAYAFSMSSILSTITGDNALSEDFERALPQLVPKLFRFLFDPNPAISNSMKEMWNALFGSNENDKTKQNAIISKYLRGIMREILNGLDQELWRIREACCYAICELFGGSSSKTFEEMAPFLKESFQKVWRVTDDIKDTCRKAANSALQKLCTFSVKACNPTYTSKRENVSKALSIMIPLLLNEGLIFPFKDVVFVSLTTLKEVVHVSSFYIKPHIAEIISSLLQQMSVLEPAEFNYLQMNAEKYGVSVEQLESLRLSAMSRSGPLSETIMDCERHIDETVLQTLVPKLLDILQMGIGLQTRANCAKFISHLGKFQGRFLKDYVVSLDMSIMNAIMQTESIAERKELSEALSQVVKNGKASEGKRLLQEILDMYTQDSLTNENENSADERRMIGAMVLEQISKNCPVLLKKFYDLALPIMFIARHDKSERVKKMWENVWEETTNTSLKNTLEIYIKVIVERCIQLLDHPTWELKRQGGSALQEVASALGILLNEKEGERELMINSLINNISGRVWEGKTILLKALGSVCETFVTKIGKTYDSVLEVKIIQTLQKECKKKDIDYKLEAIKSMYSFVKTSHFSQFMTMDLYNSTKQLMLEEMSAIENEEKEERAQEDNENKLTAMVNNAKTYHEEKRKSTAKSKKLEDAQVYIIRILYHLLPSPTLKEERKNAFNWILNELLEPKLTQYLTPSINSALLNGLSHFVKKQIQEGSDATFLDLENQLRIMKLVIFNLDPNNRQIHVRPVSFTTLNEIFCQLQDSKLLKSEVKAMLKTQMSEEFLKRILEPLLHDQVKTFVLSKLID